jgi:hypothetical protein
MALRARPVELSRNLHRAMRWPPLQRCGTKPTLLALSSGALLPMGLSTPARSIRIQCAGSRSPKILSQSYGRPSTRRGSLSIRRGGSHALQLPRPTHPDYPPLWTLPRDSPPPSSQWPLPYSTSLRLYLCLSAPLAPKVNPPQPRALLFYLILYTSCIFVPTQSQVGMARPLKIAWKHPAEVFYQLYKQERDARIAKR